MTDPPQGVRLQKVLAGAGVGSRRACEQLIAAGRVEVDGRAVTHLGTKIDPEAVVVRVDGVRIPVAGAKVYLALHKPRGVVSSMADDRGRPDLRSLLSGQTERLFHVGRLDTDTDGLLILTNDGDVAHRLAHPSYQIARTYVAVVQGRLTSQDRDRLRSGVELDDGPAAADNLTIRGAHGEQSMVELTLHEGRNRIVRRMFEAVGHPVVRLSRTQLGPVRLGTLRPGAHRPLTPTELGTLLDLVDR